MASGFGASRMRVGGLLPMADVFLRKLSRGEKTMGYEEPVYARPFGVTAEGPREEASKKS
jgi:hypothetical protein